MTMKRIFPWLRKSAELDKVVSRACASRAEAARLRAEREALSGHAQRRREENHLTQAMVAFVTEGS